jgi:phosphoribosyl 1,2-cyclic phosphate phosphodiesterase
LRTSIFVTYGGTAISVDIGPDFRQQMLTNKISDVDAVLLTHEHDDHVSGLDDIRPINFRQKKHIPLYGLPRVVADLRARYRYVFDTAYAYSGKPRVDLVEIDSSPLRIGAIAIQPIEVMHGNLDILGYRFGKFAYITDVKTLSDASIAQLQGLEVLIINALHRSTHYSHMNLVESLAMIQRIKPKQAYLTHLSHAMGVAQEVEQELPDHVALAYDNQRIEIEYEA